MDQNTSDSLFGLQVDASAGANFREGAKWARFIAFFWFGAIILGTIVLIFSGAAIKLALAEYLPGMDALGGIFLIICFFIFAYLMLINMWLYKFATLTRRGIAERNQELFNDGLKMLKYYFVVNGAIAILGLIFTFIGTLTTLIA